MIEVLRKASLVLTELERHGELSAVELAALTDEPKTSVYRLLRSMQELDLVERSTRRAAFRLGPKILELASGVLRRYNVREAAAPLLAWLHDDIGQTVYLMVRQSDRAVCVEKIDGKWVQIREISVGGSLPLHVGAAPRCLLAFEDRADWAAYIARQVDFARRPRSPATAEELREALEDVRSRGYAVADGETVLGVAAVSAPVYDADGRVHAAISVSGPSPSLLGDHLGEMSEKVVRAASLTSEAMGSKGIPGHAGHPLPAGEGIPADALLAAATGFSTSQ